MKKLILLFALFVTVVISAQTTVHPIAVKLEVTPRITSSLDTLLFIGADDKIKTVFYSDLLAKMSADIGGGAGDLSGVNSPIANDIARFTTSTTLEGRSYAELISDLGLDALYGRLGSVNTWTTLNTFSNVVTAFGSTGNAAATLAFTYTGITGTTAIGVNNATNFVDQWENDNVFERNDDYVSFPSLSDAEIDSKGVTSAVTKGWVEAQGFGGGGSPLTTKGDIFTYDTGDQRLAISGNNGWVLSEDSGEATGLKWIALGGGGDMLLGTTQTVTANKTFEDGTFLLRNVADTFDGLFSNTNTADRVYTLQDAAGTLAFTTRTISGITGTKAQFDTAVTDGNILYVGDVTSNVSTSLSAGTITATTYGITSDGSSDDIILPEATTTVAGLLGADKWDEIVANTIKTTNQTHTGQVTGATALTVDVTTISNQSLVTAVTGDMILIEDLTDGQLKRVNASDFLGGGSGDVTAASNLGDNLLIRGDGATKGVQNSGISIDDSDNLTGVGTIDMLQNYGTGNLTLLNVESTVHPGTGSIAIKLKHPNAVIAMFAYGPSAPAGLEDAVAITGTVGSKIIVGAGAGMPIEMYTDGDFANPVVILGTDDSATFKAKLIIGADPTTGDGVGDRDYNDLRHASLGITGYTDAGSYTPVNAHIGGTIDVTGGTQIILDDSGLTIDGQWIIFNRSGGSLEFAYGTGDSAIQGTLSDLPDKKYAWLHLDATNSWSVMVEGQSGSPEGTAVLSTGESGGTKFLREDGDGTSSWQVPSGSGDMLLGTTQTVTAAKTFENTTFLLRNVADTFDGLFVNTNTADRIYTLQDAAGTLAFTTRGVVGITGTKAQFDTSVTDGNILYVGDVTSNVSTALSAGTITATTYGITSDGGADDIVLPEATTTVAGLLGADKWDEIVANTLKNTNISTDLSMGTVSGTQYTINSSDGNNVNLPLADTNNWGIISDEIFDEIVANNAKTTNQTHSGDVVGSTVLTLQSTAISAQSLVTAVTGDMILIEDLTDGQLKRVNASDFLSGGTPTALSTGTVTATTYGITSDGSSDDIILPEATTTVAGLLGADKWDEIVANTTHISSDGSDHTFVDQDVTTTGDPTFVDVTVTTISGSTALTGVAVSLNSQIGKYYNMASANSGTTYTFSGGVIGGWAISLINTTSEPVVTSATKIAGADWVTGTNMKLVVMHDGTTTQFFFLEL